MEDDEDDALVEYDDDLWPDETTYNTMSGWSHNTVQARDIHGDVVFHTTEPAYFEALPWGFSVAVYVAAFVVAGAFAHATTELDMGLWGWPKLLLSTVVLLLVFVATEYRLHGVEFWALRMLGIVVIVVLGANYGDTWPLTKALASGLSLWMVWRF